MRPVLIVRAIFYKDIADFLLEGAKEYLTSQNIAFEVIDVPGAFEIPATVTFAAESELYEGFVALGCVIRGQTSHYDYVCQESARGLNDLALYGHLAIGYGILTVENHQQATVRADPKQKNKGKDAADACLQMIKLKQKFNVA